MSQSLAGRAAYLQLAPFSVGELSPEQLDPLSIDRALFRGFFPPLYDRPFSPRDWFSQYVQTYLERNLTQMVNVKDMSAFRRFLGLCAGRNGQIINMSDLARDAGVSHTTARSWLSIPEAAFLNQSNRARPSDPSNSTD